MLVDVLAHHGVKGMKWGIRKAPEHPPSEDHLQAEAHRAKAKSSGIKALSNSELESWNKRRQLEETHKTLEGKRPNGYKTGRKVVKEVLDTVKLANDIHTTAKTVSKAFK